MIRMKQSIEFYMTHYRFSQQSSCKCLAIDSYFSNPQDFWGKFAGFDRQTFGLQGLPTHTLESESRYRDICNSDQVCVPNLPSLWRLTLLIHQGAQLFFQYSFFFITFFLNPLGLEQIQGICQRWFRGFLGQKS